MDAGMDRLRVVVSGGRSGAVDSSILLRDVTRETDDLRPYGWSARRRYIVESVPLGCAVQLRR